MPTFPVDIEAWLAPFRVVAQTFDLGEGLQVQPQTAGGEVLRIGGSARLWRGTLTLAPVSNDDAAGLEARLNVLRGAGAYFTLRDYRRSGTISATLATVQANGAINISGGPANAMLRGGDYVAFGYAGRLALHQIVTGGALSGTGTRSGVEVVPPLRPGWTAGVTLTIGSPKLRAVMVPGTLRVGVASDDATDGISFDWIQTLQETR